MAQNVLNFRVLAVFEAVSREIFEIEVLTKKKRYDIFLYCVSMDGKPLEQRKMPARRGFCENSGLRNTLKIHNPSENYQKINIAFRTGALWAAGRDDPRQDDEDRGD